LFKVEAIILESYAYISKFNKIIKNFNQLGMVTVFLQISI
jgi:hypothetical protein